MNSNELSKPKKFIRIELSMEEHQNLKDQAIQQHCPLKTYISNRLLDDKLGSKLLSDRIMQMMPSFYNLVSEIDDISIRNELMDFGGAICRYLK